MKLRHIMICGTAAVVLIGVTILSADGMPAEQVVGTPPVYVPNIAHENDPLPDSVFAWSNLSPETTVPADAANAHFTFGFTNVSSGKVAILDVHPSCGCTTAQLPTLPWVIEPGSNEQFGITVNLAGKNGTLYKTVNVKTDKGFKELMVKITILAPVIPTLTEEERARDLAVAKTDRQAVFHNDCATCHAKSTEGRYGKMLYDSVCAICHESKDRAPVVPDLHNLKIPTNVDFWQIWIAHGKPGSLMPAFSSADGGPLSDMQIASLASYLNAVMSGHPAPELPH